tara:strand:+ start:844 stop:1773 length:930 start_codon:yes stop_codon:yes gene_type:complete
MISDPSNQLDLFYHNSEFSELKSLYLSNKLPNKILISGKKGIGKCTLAYHLVNFILSSDEEFSYNLNHLKINQNNKTYKLIQNKSHPNFTLVDLIEEKKNIDINQIRNLILDLNKSSFNTKPRLVLIDNIELLNINSVNALLKILEEPNENTNFILINNNNKILPTLTSRCLEFKIHINMKQSIEIANKILDQDVNDLLNNELVHNYISPGEMLRLIDIGKKNNIDLKLMNLKELIKQIIFDKKYKKDISIKQTIYSLIEIYFKNNTSIKNIKLMDAYKYFLKKIDDTKRFNLDEEILFMEFEDRILNG